MMAPDGLDHLRQFDAIYFGAVGWPGVPDHISLWGLRLAICQGFDQYACVRPVRLLPGVPSPLRDAPPERIDWVVVRENSEGEYAGIGGGEIWLVAAPDREVAVQTGAVHRPRAASGSSATPSSWRGTRKRQKVTSVTKSNAQQIRHDPLGRDVRRVAADYPDVGDRTLAGRRDGGALRAAAGDARGRGRAPTSSATSSPTLGSALGGSLGIAASANLDPERRHPSMFEPVHGSAPRHRRQGHRQSDRRHLDRRPDARPSRVGRRGRECHARDRGHDPAGIVTPDLGGTATTSQVGDAVADALTLS